MARSDGKRVHWPDPTHRRAGEADLLGHGRHKWRAAREIIDWSIEGKSIFDRKRPLSRKTLARIYAGAVKFRWPAPFLVILRNHMDAQSVDEPVPTLCSGGNHIELAQPFLLNRHGENGLTRAHDLDEPMPTADCRGAGYLCEPFVANLAHAGADESRCRTIGEPLQTLHAGGGSHALDEPFIMSGQSGGASREISDPMPGMTGRLGSVLIVPYYGHGSGESCSSPELPLPTVTTKARFGLVVPVTRSNGGPAPRSTDDPLPTLITAKGGEFTVVMPVTHADGGNRTRTVDEPLPTVTGARTAWAFSPRARPVGNSPASWPPPVRCQGQGLANARARRPGSTRSTIRLRRSAPRAVSNSWSRSSRAENSTFGSACSSQKSSHARWASRTRRRHMNSPETKPKSPSRSAMRFPSISPLDAELKSAVTHRRQSSGDRNHTGRPPGNP